MLAAHLLFNVALNLSFKLDVSWNHLQLFYLIALNFTAIRPLVVETLFKKQDTCLSQGGVKRWKVQKSTESVGFILLEPYMSEWNLRTIHPIVVEILQSETKWWTDPTLSSTEPCSMTKTVIISVYAELIFRKLSESESLELSCTPQLEHSSLTGLHLYHRNAQSQTTLLSMAEGGEVRVNPEHRGRLQLRGGLDSLQINVTTSHLKPSDTGLYVLELSYRENNSEQIIFISAQKVFLLVEGTGMWFTPHNAHLQFVGSKTNQNKYWQCAFLQTTDVVSSGSILSLCCACGLDGFKHKTTLGKV